MLKKLPRPFFVLAPMDDVTDTVFRQIIADCAPPDLFFTEFINVDALQSKGREATLPRLQFTKKEKPLIAQIWGLKPENFYKTAREIADGSLVQEANWYRRKFGSSKAQGNKEKRATRTKGTGSESHTKLTQRFAKSGGGVTGSASKQADTPNFSGIDINFGCPIKNVVQNGACSALILPENRGRAVEIIEAVKEGVTAATRNTQLDAAQGENAERNETYKWYDEMSNASSQRSDAPESPSRVIGSASEQGRVVRGSGSLPVSVKTRTGFNEVDLSWHELLLKQKLNMLSIHGRTKSQLSKVPVDWTTISRIRELRDKLSPATLIVGNGDVLTKSHGLEIAEKYKLDGIMIGRGVFQDPFVFADKSPWVGYGKKERTELYKKHIELFQQTYEYNTSATYVDEAQGSNEQQASRTQKYDEPAAQTADTAIRHKHQQISGSATKQVGVVRSLRTLNKFCKIYINGFDGAKELRESLMKAKTVEELIGLLG